MLKCMKDGYLALVAAQHVQAEQELHIVALHNGHAARQELISHPHRRLQHDSGNIS